MLTTFAQDLDWNLLKVFTEIVEADGISHAARKTGKKQPAVSLALKRLESRLGTRLCHRGPGGFVLTDEGEQVANICASLMHLVNDVPNHLTGGPREIGR